MGSLAAGFPTSFCVTVSMMVPKAGIVDILTELKKSKTMVLPFIVTPSLFYAFSPLVCPEARSE